MIVIETHISAERKGTLSSEINFNEKSLGNTVMPYVMTSIVTPIYFDKKTKDSDRPWKRKNKNSCK